MLGAGTAASWQGALLGAVRCWEPARLAVAIRKDALLGRDLGGSAGAASLGLLCRQGSEREEARAALLARI
jgi:hypothetical protein